MWTVALGIWHWYQIKIWISLVQNKFCLCLSFLEKEMNSAEPFALKKMMMFMPRSNLCWRYYKHLQFLPYICTFFLRTGRPGATTFFSAPPFFARWTPYRCQDRPTSELKMNISLIPACWFYNNLYLDILLIYIHIWIHACKLYETFLIAFQTRRE